MSKFLLLLGPSGVGKSAIIDELCKLDDRFIYISPYMTRPLRNGESNKVSIDDTQMDEMSVRGELLVINQLYGVRYATPREPITQALDGGRFPVLDWPISRLEVMTGVFPKQLYRVYLSPPSIEVLRKRLATDGRDKDGGRLQSAREELEAYWSSKYAGMYDFEIISAENQVSQIARSIYIHYRRSFRVDHSGLAV